MPTKNCQQRRWYCNKTCKKNISSSLSTLVTTLTCEHISHLQNHRITNNMPQQPEHICNAYAIIVLWAVWKNNINWMKLSQIRADSWERSTLKSEYDRNWLWCTQNTDSDHDERYMTTTTTASMTEAIHVANRSRLQEHSSPGTRFYGSRSGSVSKRNLRREKTG